MKKQKKILIVIMSFIVFLFIDYSVFATDYSDDEIVFSQEYIEYIESDDKENMTLPRMYDIPKNSTTSITNPLRLARLLKSSIQPQFSLKDIIPENVVIKNQAGTNACWAFANLSSLETYFALQDYKAGVKPVVVYDFSEQHMNYATTRVFADGKINQYGFNRTAGDVAVSGIPMAYFTNGSGVVLEEEMTFDGTTGLIDISEIQNKNLITQVNDMITFPSYSSTDDTSEIKKQIKEHILNYGSVATMIHSASYFEGSQVYNSITSSAYCNSTSYKIDHSVSIVGWDDNYSRDYFVEGNKPANNGAWIIKNSWGTESGDNGYIYLSYEDVNVYKYLTGIEDAQMEREYENLYQYDELGGFLKYKIKNTSKIYLASEFDKKTTGKEYITHISIQAPETYTCKVYVNPNGTSKSKENLQVVELKTGETETITAGYHTIEFLNPVKINSDSFVIVLEIQGTQEDSITTLIEMNYGEFYTDSKYANAANHDYDCVTIADQKCFFAREEEFAENNWRVTSKMYETSKGKIPNFDTTIKAFTTSKVLENITVETPPNKTNYVVGQNFDPTGMVVNANYANGNSIEITDYTIQNGENLALNQSEVTIIYNGFTTTQEIEVEKNTLQKIEIKNKPQKIEYWAGDNFESTGMLVEAIYKDGTRIILTDYKIDDGQALKNNQTTVTIRFEDKEVLQEITVKPNIVQNIQIIQEPQKINYVEGQNFDKTGMIVIANYANGTSKEILDYEILDEKKLSTDQTTVTIKFEETTAIQLITVVKKTVTNIKIKTIPSKVKYIQTRENLDLTGGSIEIFYNDNTSEEMLMMSEEISVSGFDNSVVGKQIITLDYKEKTASFEVEIVELEKPVNSNFKDMKGSVTRIRNYSYTNKDKKDHIILNIKLSDIIKVTENENMKYYYYLSINPNEKNIANWIEIKELQQNNNNIDFEANTLNVTNYEELASASKIYLYVKEVATRNGMKSEKTTNSVMLDAENIVVEEFVNDEKKSNLQSESAKKDDNTKAPGMLPKAGKDILMIAITILIITIGKVSYSKYKDIQLR